MIVYIAGPMTGLPEFNYPQFNAAAEILHMIGHTPLNPVDSEKLNPTGEHQTWDWYMRHALRQVLDAEALAVLPGWEKSRGASLEVRVATSLGLLVLPLDRWIEAAA